MAKNARPPGGAAESEGGGPSGGWGWTPPWKKNQKNGAPAGSGPYDKEAVPEPVKNAAPRKRS